MSQSKSLEQYQLIQSHAIKARSIFDLYGKELDSNLFKNFPKGCCRYSCELLGKWLQLNNIRNVEYVWGTKGSDYHAWLEVKDCILDITFDQFPENTTKVYFSKNKNFYKQFTNQKRVAIELSKEFNKTYL
ncbi:MAG: hypothetical protein WED10_14775, partial [Brumimicrobium sp.]